MATQRVSDFLASLMRLEPAPTSAVEKSLSEQGAPCFDSWLAVHEKYAGYVQSLGSGDYAVWGIVHREPNWLSPLAARVEREVREPTWYVTCADVHPSYVYNLDQEGRFSTPPAASFDIYVERNALVWDFFRQGNARRAPYGEAKDATVLASIQHDIERGALALVPEASDDNVRYFSGSALLVSRDAGSGALRQIWRRK